MIRSEVLAIAFGLASAASWGSGDFGGGLASRRGSVYSVVIISQLIGAVFLVTLALSLGENIPSADNLILGGIAGVSGAIGLVALYMGLASGRMGVVAPVTAMVAAAIGWLEDDNKKNDGAAVNILGAFINAASAQSGKKIPESQADALIAEAAAIIEALQSG